MREKRGNLPIPGGPESNAALRGPFGAVKLFTLLLGLLNVPSHRSNHRDNLSTLVLFPRISSVDLGAYLSAHSAFGPSDLPLLEDELTPPELEVVVVAEEGGGGFLLAYGLLTGGDDCF